MHCTVLFLYLYFACHLQMCLPSSPQTDLSFRKMLPKVRNLEECLKIRLDVIKHSDFKRRMFRVCTEHYREGQRMRRREGELSVVRKPQDL